MKKHFLKRALFAGLVFSLLNSGCGDINDEDIINSDINEQFMVMGVNNVQCDSTDPLQKYCATDLNPGCDTGEYGCGWRGYREGSNVKWFVTDTDRYFSLPTYSGVWIACLADNGCCETNPECGIKFEEYLIKPGASNLVVKLFISGKYRSAINRLELFDNKTQKRRKVNSDTVSFDGSEEWIIKEFNFNPSDFGDDVKITGIQTEFRGSGKIEVQGERLLVSYCGDDFCAVNEGFETRKNCPNDCYCGDGVCSASDYENPNTCPRDCPAVCDDGYCSQGENYLNCNEDCDPFCGDGICSGMSEKKDIFDIGTERALGENAGNCETDCPAICGDGFCTHNETPDLCTDDCICTDDSTCHADAFCFKDPKVGCDGIGACEYHLNKNCPLYIDYVCGCNDVTYGNPCEAFVAGVNVAYKDACTNTGGDSGKKCN